MTRRVLASWGPLLAALAGVFYLSSLSRVPGAEYFWDKLLHTAGYTVVSLLTLRAFASFLFMLLWSVSDEYHQSFVPGRDSSAGDVVADMIGFTIACALLQWWARRRA